MGRVVDGVHGQRVFARKKARGETEVAWLLERGYGVQDGGPSGLWVFWCDAFVTGLDLSKDPNAVLEAVVQRRELVPYNTPIVWWDAKRKSGGAVDAGFGAFKPLLVSVRDCNLSLDAQREALSYIARTTKAGAQ